MTKLLGPKLGKKRQKKFFFAKITSKLLPITSDPKSIFQIFFFFIFEIAKDSGFLGLLDLNFTKLFHFLKSFQPYQNN